MALNIKNLFPLPHPKQTKKGGKITLAFGEEEQGLDNATEDRHRSKKRYKFTKINNLTKINIIN